MSSYLGTLGRLVKIECPASQNIDTSERYSYSRTLEGRVKAQVMPLARRSWDVNVNAATPSDVGTLMAFTHGEWGNGPFVWVAEGAAVTNMLTPAVASCGPEAVRAAAVTVVGPLLLPDGSWAGRSLANATPGSWLMFGPSTVPVIPGARVTASAYLLGAGAKVGVQFLNAAGSPITQFTSTASGVAGVATRLSVTATVPALAVSCVVYGANASQGVRPALTWTPQLMEWGDGQGCDKALISAPRRNLVLALDDPRGGRYTDASFTVQEVG